MPHCTISLRYPFCALRMVLLVVIFVAFLANHQFVQVEELKNKGNELFKKKDYRGALDQYNKSIDVHVGKHVESSSLPILYCNSAMARLKLKDWQRAKSDAQDAINGKKDYTKVQCQIMPPTVVFVLFGP